jgi:hypothetical protein
MNATVPEGEFAEVDAGYTFALARRTDGTLAYLGCGERGTSEIPQGHFIGIGCGQFHAFALDTCYSDMDRTHQVNSGDIAVALLDFGLCENCDSDLDGNGQVDAGDIAWMLLDFGPCP